MAVSVQFGVASTPGVCELVEGVSCQEVLPCKFGAIKVTVTGSGNMQWRDGITPNFGKVFKLDNSSASASYGSAASPGDFPCGSGLVVAYFPDDLAGGGPQCTSCN
jgi:hypothetical protein